MSVTRVFQPRFAGVGAYARGGAAGVAQRENTSRSIDRAQQADIAQAHINLQREGMYQSAVARMADSRNQAAQAAAALKARQDEAEANRQHAESMQQTSFSNASTMAEANSGREFEMRQKLATEATDQQKVQYDYQLTRQGEIRNAQANHAIERVKEMHAAGQLTDDDRNQALLSIEADRNSIERMPVPKRKIPIVTDELKSRQHVDDTGTYLMQPDGQIDFRPKVPDKPQVSFGDYVSATTAITQQLTKMSKDAEGNEITVPPAPEEVQRQLGVMMQSYSGLMAPRSPTPAAAPQPAPQPSVAPSSEAPVAAQPGAAMSAPVPAAASLNGAPKAPVAIQPAAGMSQERIEYAIKELDRISKLPPDQLSTSDKLAARMMATQLGILGN